jgi:SRSO17 transposase
LGKPWHRYKDNIKAGLKETDCEDVEWIQVAQNRVKWQVLENTTMSFRFHTKWRIF